MTTTITYNDAVTWLAKRGEGEGRGAEHIMIADLFEVTDDKLADDMWLAAQVASHDRQKQTTFEIPAKPLFDEEDGA